MSYKSTVDWQDYCSSKKLESDDNSAKKHNKTSKCFVCVKDLDQQHVYWGRKMSYDDDDDDTCIGQCYVTMKNGAKNSAR